MFILSPFLCPKRFNSKVEFGPTKWSTGKSPETLARKTTYIHRHPEDRNLPFKICRTIFLCFL